MDIFYLKIVFFANIKCLLPKMGIDAQPLTISEKSTNIFFRKTVLVIQVIFHHFRSSLHHLKVIFHDLQ